MKDRRFGLVIIFFLFWFAQLSAQDDVYTISGYSFIRNDLNSIIFSKDSSGYDSLFVKLNKLIMKGEGQINIVHIGDSHIQADYFSGRMRERLQTFFQGALGSRGFIFPAKLIHSNNPFNFYVSSTGNWVGCRNIERNKTCTLGLAGASATTYDTNATIFIRLRSKDYPTYDFNRVKVFHNMDTSSYDVNVNDYHLKQEFIDYDSLGYSEFILNKYSDSVTISVTCTDTLQHSFTLYGISLENEDPGITYHSVGVNGAEVESYLRCDLFSYQLSLLSPDLVIVSLGTNDCFSAKWDSSYFERNLTVLIQKIRQAKSGVPVLLTTPSDNYRRRRYKNPDVAVASRIIFRVAAAQNCAAWNLYEIMGGYGSMLFWYKAGLTANDKLHFSKTGYYIQGDLLFSAFLKAYDRFIEKMMN